MSRYSFHIKTFLRRQGCQRMIARGRTWKTSFEPTLERRKVNRMKRRWVSRTEKSKNENSTMTFEGRRRSCLSLLRAFSAKIFSGRHARHLWNVLWHEKMLEKTTSLFWHGISRNCGCFGEENFFATFFVDGFDWIFKELSFFSFFFYKKWIFSFLFFDWRGLIK